MKVSSEPLDKKSRQRERESHLLNPPPGSTDPERFATVSIGKCQPSVTSMRPAKGTRCKCRGSSWLTRHSRRRDMTRLLFAARVQEPLASSASHAPQEEPTTVKLLPRWV